MNMRNIILLSATTLVVVSGCITAPYKNKKGVEEAVNDIARLNSRLSTLRTAARQNNKPALTNDLELITAYNDAAFLVNAYWTNVIGDVKAYVPIDRSAQDYLDQPAHKAVTEFTLIVSNKLASLIVKESTATIVAENVIAVFDYFFKRVDQKNEKAREEFVRYLASLSVPDWNAKFEMPQQPSFMTNAPVKTNK